VERSFPPASEAGEGAFNFAKAAEAGSATPTTRDRFGIETSKDFFCGPIKRENWRYRRPGVR
jgi:hypothetical protein